MKEIISLGARLFRLPYGSKIPFSRWKDEAKIFTDETEAANWFVGFNIGVVCDQKLVIIDVEGPKKTGSANGWPTLHAYERVHGNLPMAPEYSTPSGGGGIVFRRPSYQVPFVDLGVSHGLEMRSGAHFNLLPNSYFDGEKAGKGYSGHYQWKVQPSDVLASEGEIPEIPRELVEWFLSQTEKQESQPGNSVLRSDFAFILKENLDLISADLSYPQWWEVMAICHRIGDEGKELFVKWSEATGGARWKGEETVRQINASWTALNKSLAKREAEGLPLLGLSRLMQIVVEQNPPARIEMPHVSAQVSEPEPWPLLPLFGAAETFRLALARSMPWQEEMTYAFPLLCAQLALQRQVVFWRDGLQSHWWTFVGGPNSNKTTFRTMLAEILALINPKLVIDSIESTNGLKTMLAEFPNRVLLMDEGIKTLNAMLVNEGKSTFDAKMVGFILNMHNNKGNQEATSHRVKAYRLPRVVLPQMSLVSLDQEAYWNAFRSSQATENGLLSRTFMFRLGSMPLDYDARVTKRVTNEETQEFTRALRKLVPHQERFRANEEGEDFHSWSPIDLNQPSDFNKTVEAGEVFRQFNNSMIEWSSQSPERGPLLLRTVEAAKLLAQLCCALDDRQKNTRVTAEHARAACGLAYRSLHNVGIELDSFELRVMKRATEILTEKGAMSARRLVMAMGNVYYRGDGQMTKTCRILKDLFQLKDGKFTAVL